MDRFSVNSGAASVGGNSATATAAAVAAVNSGNSASGNIATASSHNNNNIVSSNNNSNSSGSGVNSNSSNNSINSNGSNNNSVKLRPDRNGNAISSLDSTTGLTSSTSSSLLVSSSYRKSFHRSGPGSASATSDYSMSTLAESIEDDHLNNNGSPSNNTGGTGGNTMHQHQHHSNGGGSSMQQTGLPSSGHNTSGLPGLPGQNNSNLTQAGLEEYSRSYYEQTMYHHQKQSSYAQSEGYHSYVSSSDSSSTPFLDRLRQDSELLLSRSTHNWSQQDLQLSSSNNSIADNNSSESTSSTETLKWLGSMSDVSEASHATSMSALSSAGSTSQLIAHSSRVRTPQRHNSESILFMSTDEQQQQQQHQQQQLQHQSVHSHQSPQGVTPIGSLMSQSMGSLHPHHHHHHPLGHPNAQTPSPNGSIHQASQQQHHQRGSSSSSSGGSPVEEDLRYQQRTLSNTSLASSASAPPSSSGSVRSSRSNNRLFPISTYTEIPSNVSSSSNNSSGSNNTNSSSNGHTGPAAATSGGANLVDSSKQLSPHNWQSVAERINELEKHQQQGLPLISNSGSNSNINSSANPSSASIGAKNLSQSANKQQQQQLQKYTYFDPSKTHRVSNPSLKAFQKNAVISYFERQQAYARESCHNLSRPTTLNLQQPQQQQQPQSQSASPPSMKSVSQRSSISSAYSSSGSTTDLTPSSHSPIGGSYHHHPSLHSPANIAAQQRLDKIAANNLRNQLASVHTMNFLNKVSPSQTAQLIESQMISNATLILSGSPGTTASDGQMQCSPATPEDPLDANMSPPPPPPRSRSIGAPSFNSTATTTMATAAMHASHLTAVRRTSSASEYSSVRDKMIQQRQQLSKDLLGPMIMGPIIALDDWVPERPPKNPMLRIPSPELPPPPPMMSPTEDVILINQDEPLPPPPPEILRHIRQLSGDSGEPKSNAASRRNSFAGQSCRKTLYRASTFENLSPPPAGTSPPQQPQTQSQISQLIIPPAVPKKPQPMTIEPQVIYRRPSSSLSKSNSHQHQTAISGSNAMHQAHRALMNGKLDQQQQRHSLPMIPLQTSPPHLQQPALPQFLPRQSDSRISLRKRSHNSQQMAEYLLKAASGLSSAHYLNGQIVPPPVVSSNSTAITPPPLPLKPRMTILGQQASPVVTAPLPPPPAAAAVLDGSLNGGQLISMGSKRSNSKASYLPRQPRDKLHSDPDHGSYKLTLTSNEDSINHNDVFSEDIITSPKCNLPDVLPPGVKYSLYSNNNNNNNNNTNNTNGKPIGKPPKTIPHSAPIISANSLKSMFNFAPQQPQQNQVTPPSASSPVTPPPAYTATKQQQPISQPGSPTNQAISPKYTSQSTFDLKKTQILDSKYLTQSPPQIGLPSPIPSSQQQQQQPNGAINNANYLNHQQHSTNNICNQQTVNNCNEISEKSDFFEPSNNSTSTSTVEPVEAANHNNKNNTSTNVGSDHHSPAHDDGFSAKEEEDSISSCNTTICAEAEQPVQTTCSSSSSSKASAEEPKPPPVALERVTKEISLEPVEIATSSEIHTTPTKVVQRTEIVLRVAAPTTEASSQTDDDLVAAASENSPRSTGTTTAGRTSSSPSLSVGIAELVIDHNPAASAASGASSGSIAISRHTVATSTSSSPPGTPTSGGPKATGSFFSKICAVAPRKVHPEEIDCDKLSHDLISQLSPSDKLHTILAPKTFKSSSDYVSDLFNIQIAPRPMKKDASTATPEASPQRSPLDILTTSSTYFQVSEPKAKLMTRYSREMTLINGDCCDLTKKKEELVQRLGKKLLVLSNEQTSIAEESNANDLLGNDVALKVAQKVRPTDASKFRSYVDDVGYITMLLLSLSGRLARTDNALYNIDDTHPDKKILEAKRERLLEQLDEAKQLKDDIDRRGAIISKLLEKSLTIEEYADYDYFINMKAKLIVDSREIADKIKLGEEQLAALKDTLVQSEC